MQRGITQHMLVEYIRNILAQAAGALDTYPLILVVDRATIHNEQKMIEEFHDWGCQELVEVLKMPGSCSGQTSVPARQRTVQRMATTRAGFRAPLDWQHQATNE